MAGSFNADSYQEVSIDWLIWVNTQNMIITVASNAALTQGSWDERDSLLRKY